MLILLLLFHLYVVNHAKIGGLRRRMSDYKFRDIEILHPAVTNSPNSVYFYVGPDAYPNVMFVHDHIPKTGGTTLLTLMRNMNDINTNSNCKIDTIYTPYSDLEKLTINCRFVSSEFRLFAEAVRHFSKRQKPVKELVMIRDPLHHVLSAIAHDVRKGHYQYITH